MNPLLQAETAERTDPLEDLRQTLSPIIEEYVERETAAERAKRYLQIRRVNAYMQGDQFAVLNADATTGALDYAGGSISGLGGSGGDRGAYDYNFDVVKTYGRKYGALLGGRPFYNAVAQPRNPTRENDRKAARCANTLREWLSSCWDLPTRNIEYFTREWDSGEVYGHLQYVADEGMFGKVEVPQYAPREVVVEPGGFLCRNCGAKSPEPAYLDALDPMGMPAQVMACPQCRSEIADGNWEEPVTATVPEFAGTAKFPQAGPRLTLCTPLTVTVALDCKDSLENTPFLRYEYEEHKGVLLQYFGDELRKLADSVDGSVRGGKNDPDAAGKNARAAEFAQSGSGLPNLTNRWTFTRLWLRPAMYEYVADKDKRDEYKARYPTGMKISLVDGAIIRVEAENLSDVWAVGVPEPGKSVQHRPLARSILGHQDALNDQGNIMIALLERALPTYGYRADLFNAKAFQRKGMLPAEAIPILPSYGGRVEDAIVKFPTASFPDQAMPLSGWIVSNLEQHTGLLPGAWGGGGGGKKTALQVQQELAQALQVLGTPGVYASRFYAQIYDLAVKMVVREAKQDIEVGIEAGGISTADTVDLEALKNGDYKFKCDPGVPMSNAELQSRIDNIISQSPGLATALGLAPADGQQYRNLSNVGALVDLILPGVTALQIPGKAEWDYTARKIEQLVDEQPIMAPDGAEQPSQQPEEFVINYATEANNVAQWCLSTPGQKEAERNKLGYRNVVLYGKACFQRSQPPPPPPDQPGGTPPSTEQIGEPPNV